MYVCVYKMKRTYAENIFLKPEVMEKIVNKDRTCAHTIFTLNTIFEMLLNDILHLILILYSLTDTHIWVTTTQHKYIIHIGTYTVKYKIYNTILIKSLNILSKSCKG